MIARNNNADMMISLHINATGNSVVKEGAEVYVTANKLLPKYNEQSTIFGEIVLDELSKLGINNRGVMTRLCGDTGPKWEYSDGSVADYYAVIRYPMKGAGEDRGADLAKGEGIPGILIEHCYIDSNDIRFIDSDEDIKRLARADCEAFVRYLNLEKKSPDRVSKLSLDKTDLILVTKEEYFLNALIEPSTALNKKISWTSSNESVATVSADGKITALSCGETIITAETDDRKKRRMCKVVVKDAVEIDKTKWNLIVGNKVQIYGKSNVENSNLIWKSNNEDIAKVDSNGLVTAIKEGQAAIEVINEKNNSGKDIIINVYKLSENESINIIKYSNNNEKLSKIGDKKTIEDFKKQLSLSDNLNLVVYNSKNNILKDDEYITTNSKIQIKRNDKIIQEYVALIYGDVNEDGKISALDYAVIKNHIMDVKSIDNEIDKLVSDVNGDGKISAIDYAVIKNHIMDVKKLDLK